MESYAKAVGGRLVLKGKGEVTLYVDQRCSVMCVCVSLGLSAPASHARAPACAGELWDATN